MSVLNGDLAPVINVTYKKPDGTTAVDTITVSGNMAPQQSFTPDFNVHELDDDTIEKELRGYRYKIRIPYDIAQAEDLIKYARITHQVAVQLQSGAVITGYDSIELYPYSVTKPYYHIPVVLTDNTINLEQYYELGMKDFELELESLRLLDWVPLSPTTFTNWGNITERLDDLTSTFDEYELQG